MFFNKNNVPIGTVKKELSISRFIYGDFVNWHWKRKFFKRFSIDPLTAINPHIAIVGESGSGKSNLCRLILNSLASRNISFILLDPHNEYVEFAREFGAQIFDAGRSGINPFDLEGLGRKEKTGEVANLFRKVFRLGSVQHYLLHRCIAYAYKASEEKGEVPTMHDLLFWIGRFKLHASPTEKKILDALEKRMLVLDPGTFSKGIKISGLLGSRSIFALSGLHTHEAQELYLEGFLKHLYILMLGQEKSRSVRLYVVIDEAEKLSESPNIARLVAEGRKYGIGIICISQRAKALHAELRSNSSLFVAFAQHEPEELNYVANFISQGNENNRYIEVKKGMRNLHRGSAIVLDSSSREPKLVRFDLFAPRKRDPTYRILRLATNAICKRELYRLLKSDGYSLEEMNHSLSGLLERGELKSHLIGAAKYEGVWYMAHPKNSAEHDICVNLIKRHLSAIGISSMVHNAAYGPDLIALVKGRRAAVEYESGRQSFDQAARMLEGRKKKFPLVIVVVNDGEFGRYSKIAGVCAIRSSDFFGAQDLSWSEPKEDIHAPGYPNPSGKE